MHVIQLLLPLQDNDGAPFPHDAFLEVHRELADRFGGATAFLQSPALGAWKSEGETVQDRMVLFEVMTDTLERAWWAQYRQALEKRFRQEALLVRAYVSELL